MVDFNCPELDSSWDSPEIQSSRFRDQKQPTPVAPILILETVISPICSTSRKATPSASGVSLSSAVEALIWSWTP
jgi:hypothetical protein